MKRKKKTNRYLVAILWFLLGFLTGQLLWGCSTAQSTESPRYRAGDCYADINREHWKSDFITYVVRVGKYHYETLLCGGFYIPEQESFSWAERGTEKVRCPKGCPPKEDQ
jgi:hypothetical protein